MKASNGTDFLLSPDGDSVVKPLLTLAEVSCVGQWVQAVHACPRLLPLIKKVFIVVNEDHLDLYQAWARGFKTPSGTFPVDNIISNGEQPTLAHTLKPQRGASKTPHEPLCISCVDITACCMQSASGAPSPEWCANPSDTPQHLLCQRAAVISGSLRVRDRV